MVWRKDKTDEIKNLKVYNLGVKFIYLDSSSRLKIIEYLKEQEINHVIILTLDGIYANVAVGKLIKALHKKIKLICLSQRFSKKRGSLFKQTMGSIKKSGLGFTIYLSYSLLFYNFFIHLVRIFNKLTFKKREIFTLRELAQKYSIPIYVTDNINSKKSIEYLQNFNPDLIISAHFDQKINTNIINMPRYGCINLHYALLPEFGGPFPSFWGLNEKRGTLGATIMYMNENWDEGDIIQQEVVKVDPCDSVLSVDCRILDIGADLIIKVIEKIETGTVVRFDQKTLGASSYYSIPTKKEVKELKRKGIKVMSLSHYFKQLNR